MTIHVLIVEDDEDYIEEIRAIIDALPEEFEYKVARSRDEAYGLLEANFLDLVILDLKIPTVTGALDADPEHGHAVFNRIRSVAPGTPIFVLTGSPVEDFVSDLLGNQQRIDIWSEGRKTGNILFQRKYLVNKCGEVLAPIANAIECLSDVELDKGGVNLCLAEDRLIRIFAKKFQGTRCVVSSLGGGLSGAKVIRLRVTNSQGVQVHDAVAKLAKLGDVLEEGLRFDNHVVRLDPAATPRKLATLEFGAYNIAGIFFGLADGFNESAFDIDKNSAERASAVIQSVESATSRWVHDVPETRKTIREFRQRLLSDEALEKILESFELGWVPDFEAREIQTRWTCIHGDLHGCNILVSAGDATVLIDYGDVGDGPASLDPVTLELSLIFHPEAAEAAGSWPSEEQARVWGDLDAYLVGCPFSDFVRECRAWAQRIAAGNRDIAASAYSYLIRQLKYEDTDKARAITLLEGVKNFYEQST